MHLFQQMYATICFPITALGKKTFLVVLNTRYLLYKAFLLLPWYQLLKRIQKKTNPGKSRTISPVSENLPGGE